MLQAAEFSTSSPDSLPCVERDLVHTCEENREWIHSSGRCPFSCSAASCEVFSRGEESQRPGFVPLMSNELKLLPKAAAGEGATSAPPPQRLRWISTTADLQSRCCGGTVYRRISVLFWAAILNPVGWVEVERVAEDESACREVSLEIAELNSPNTHQSPGSEGKPACWDHRLLLNLTSSLGHRSEAEVMSPFNPSIHPSILQKIMYPSFYHPIHPLVRPYIHLSSTHPFCSYFIYQKVLSTEALLKRPVTDVCLFTAERKSSELSSMLLFHSAALFKLGKYFQELCEQTSQN